MRVYLDSSALIKRSVEEPESDALSAALDAYTADNGVLLSSALAWIEVSRALRILLAGSGDADGVIRESVEVALSGVAERLITEDVVSLARRTAPPRLRTLDSIHLATAVLLDSDVVLAYDERLIEACRHNGLATRSPGR